MQLYVSHSLFVNLYGFLKIVDHIGRRRGCLHDVFAALMIPWARLVGSVTTHCAFAVRLTKKQPIHSMIIFFFMMFLFLIVNRMLDLRMTFSVPWTAGYAGWSDEPVLDGSPLLPFPFLA